MNIINESDPSSYEETAGQEVWKDAMTEEYNNIMKNYVLDIVPRLERNSVVTSRWIYNIKHVADRSLDKYKYVFVSYGFS